MLAYSSTRIPSFLKARSPQGLRRLMLLNNTNNATFYQYFDIQFVGGFWFAWFYKDVGQDDIKIIEEKDTDASQGGPVNG